MQVVGRWLLCDDGVVRPVIRAGVVGNSGRTHADDFLLDSGSDRTVLSALLRQELGLLPVGTSNGITLEGIGGGADFVLLDTVLELTRDDGGTAMIRSHFAAFINPAATDLSILGRDVMDNFDLIISRRRNEVLLAPNHRYHVSRT
jgi:hypothetical protein